MKNPIPRILNFFTPKFARLSFSQEGEDLVLDRIFSRVDKGFYVDVGAHHPKRFSNTYLFYKKGWRGINVDATPGSMEIFRKVRPRDLNIESAVANSAGKSVFYLFDDPALNTFDADLIPSRLASGYRVIEQKEVSAFRLEEILRSNCPAGQKIHFLSVDVEGLDLQVLQSNDWKTYRPEIILAECIASDLQNVASNPVHIFLKSQGYSLLAKTFNTWFFKDSGKPTT